MEDPPIQHIGSAHGRIAVWLTKAQAEYLAKLYGPGDRAWDELMAAIDRAYPEEDG